MADLTREQALQALEDGRRRLDLAIDGLSDADLTRQGVIGGGDWSVKDVIGHIATWEEAALDALADVRRGAIPVIERYFREKGGVDRYNADRIPELRTLSLAEVRRRAAAASETLSARIQGMTDQEWGADVPYEAVRRRTLGNLLGSITGAPHRPFGHVFAHIADVEAFTRTC